MANVTVVYGAYTTVACSLAALASDTALLAGRETTFVDASGSRALDYLLSGRVAIGSCAGSRQLEVWSYGIVDASAFAASAAGAQADLAVTTGSKNTLKLLEIIPVFTTAAHQLTFGPYSIAKAYGGYAPSRFGAYFVHNTGDALSATHAASLVGYRTVNVSAS